MSRSSTPWDEPDANRHPSALPDAGEAIDPAQSPDIMASIDTSRSAPELVIADVSRENAWVSVEQADARDLEEWR